MIRPWYLVLILGMAAVTYATRYGFFGIARQVELHPLLKRALEYVPVSILAALVFPSVLAPSGELASPVTNVYLWCAAITTVVLLLTRRGWVAIVVGVGSMVAFRFLGN
ncbi:MAG: AzlD domain-containing protein [Actinobacteria bacterium]|nr:MAG: AzlD domain-containing protein [Actinomycetota bacterium]